MAENEELNNSDISQLHQSSSSFLEIYCTSSGKIRRFSVGTEAGFALKLINKKLSPDIPSASYIEAVKEGEESICFGPNSVLLDYGNGWRLQTVTEEGFDNQKDLAKKYRKLKTKKIGTGGKNTRLASKSGFWQKSLFTFLLIEITKRQQTYLPRVCCQSSQ